MGNEYSENLFKSIDTIISARINALPFDKTYSCYITDISQRREGIYRVKYESVEMTAYSENLEYELGDQVYVSIPKNNYNEKKVILGRIPKEKEVVVRARPFENYVACSNNFVSRERDYSIIANGAVNSVNMVTHSFTADNSLDKNAGYDTMGIRFQLSAVLQNQQYETVGGTYCVQILLNGFEQDKTKDKYENAATVNKEYIFNMKDMLNINHYNTFGFCPQEQTFDIKNFVVKTIYVNLIQKEDFVDATGEAIPADQNLMITCRDLQVTFGYAGARSDFAKGKLYIYTPDGFLYNANEDSSKRVFSRYVLYQNDIVNVYNPPNNFKYIQWYKYNPLMADEYVAILGAFAYTPIQGLNSYSNDFNLSTGKSQQSVRYRLALSNDERNWVVSDTVVFKNNVNFTSSEILDVVSGFQVSAIGVNRGVFNIYGMDNLLLNDAEGHRNHQLQISYTPTTSERRLQPGDVVRWTIPKEETMLLYGLYKNGEEVHEIVVGQGEFGDLGEDGELYLPFRIKTFYNPIYTSNTIKCELILREENGIDTVLTYDKELLFGTSGSQGSNYILQLELVNSAMQKTAAIYENDENIYYVIPHLYNYNMKEIDISQISYKWIDEQENLTTQGVNAVLRNWKNILPKKRIIQAEIAGYKITAYLPIATKYVNQYKYAAGCKVIVYDITGKKPVYYKYKYDLDGGVAGQSWALKNSNDEIPTDNSKYPKLDNDNIVQAPSIYSGDYKYVYAECSVGGNIVWIQPVCITRNKYPTAMVNEEVHQTQIGSFKIVENMVGELYNDKALFLGVYEKNNARKTGLIAIHENQEKFSIELESGKVTINGANGTIEKAEKLTTQNIGSSNVPVYFKNGIPVTTGINISTIKTNLENLTTIVTAQSATISELQTNVTSLLTRVSTLEEAVDNLQTQINNLGS